MGMDVAMFETYRLVNMRGRLDVVVAGELRRELMQMCAKPGARVAVDLRRVDFIDSAGLAALVRGLRTAEASGGSFRLIGPLSPDARRIFELTRFDLVFDIIDAGVAADAGVTADGAGVER